MMRCDFCEPRRGDGAGGARLGEDDLGGVREEQASNFVNRLVSKRSIDKPDFASGKMLFEETRELPRCARIVCTIQINLRVGLQFFEAARPDGVSNPLRDVLIRNSIAALLKIPCRS